MLEGVSLVLTGLAVVLLVPIGVFCLECLLAVLPRRRGALPDGPRPRLAVLVPAHNEELVIGRTLGRLLPQLHPDDRLLVVADNCTDLTADIARRCGAEVIERHDPQRRGKGYALDYGVRHLEAIHTSAPDALSTDVFPASQTDFSPALPIDFYPPLQIDVAFSPPLQGGAGGGEAETVGFPSPPWPPLVKGGREGIEGREGDSPGMTLGGRISGPPEVVIVLDADCDASPGSLDVLTRRAQATGRPVQAAYLSDDPTPAGSVYAVSTLGFRFKNLVRPLGLARLGLPCPLLGTGMAFPWDVIRRAALASGNIVEDMQLGIDLALAGRPPLFAPDARVTSRLPQQSGAFYSQRTRWEQGHLQTIVTQTPRLLWGSVRQRRFDLLTMALDLSVPPFSLLLMVWLAATTAAVAGGFLGAGWLPAALLAAAGVTIALSVAAGWAVFCRDCVPARTFLTVPAYMLRKVPIYVSFCLLRRQRNWVRTERESEALTTDN